ncbi:MAG: LuxR C-terminal-related transcriptional regulator [Treponema sp.]|nr:LuxR C-terminal-related transcriptional regulator [Treponema sp.]
MLRHAATQGAFASLVQMPEMTMAFIEVGFFGESMLGSLECLHKLYPRLRVVLFAVSETAAEEAARYLCWGGGSFISLRDRPEEIEAQLNAVFEGRNRTPGDVLRCMRDYERLSSIAPHLTRQEIEVIRCVAREKTRKETAYCLKVSEKTVSNHLENIRMKFGVHNLVEILKLAVTKGILPEKELWSCRFKCEGRGC